VKAQARRVTSQDIAAAVAQSNALLPSGELITPTFDANVYTNAVPLAVKTIGESVLKRNGTRPVLIRDVARVEDSGTPETQAVAVPLSFAITLIVLYSQGHTLNAFTLGGLTLAMGRLVDDAVVVLESIHRHQRKGMSTAQAALHGANAVALPVLASTLTTMAVLLPVVLLAGLATK